MKKKIVAIFVSMLLFVTVSSVTGTLNFEKSVVSLSEPNPTTTGIIWSDNFDSYTLGPLHGQGGWEGWFNDPLTTGFVTNNQSRSAENSVEIAWYGDKSADIVYMFSGVSSGTATLITYQYVPSDLEGDSCFILLNRYSHVPGDQSWSLELQVNNTRIWDRGNVEDWLPIVTDDWAEIEVIIDFEADVQTVNYDGTELLQKSWVDGASGGGEKNLAAIDLYADQFFSTQVYYDDFSLDAEIVQEPDLYCEGSIEWDNVSTGEELTGSFEIENKGANGTLLDWDIVKKPSWGEWTFVPNGGDDLEPGAPFEVEVTVIAPDEKEQQYSGQIKLQNRDNAEDSCTINVKLSTPMSKPSSLILQFLEKLIQRFPALELIFSHILG